MKILIQDPEDSISLMNEEIHAVSNGKEYVVRIENIAEVITITSDIGPFYDDMTLAMRADDGTAFFVMSEHRDYDSFLFDQLGKEFELDYQPIIAASQSIENKIFILYKRGV